MNRKKRIEEIDILKGIAIILVIVGHCIQIGFGKSWRECELFYDNLIFKVIYSFHMPLFMIISGYLCCSQNKRFQLRFRRLILPLVIWQLFFSIVLFILKKDYEINFIWLYLKNLYYPYWFLWTVFIINIIVHILDTVNYKIRCCLYIILFIISLFIMDDYNIVYLKFLLPFYLFGYYYKKRGFTINNFIKIFEKKRLIILLVIYIVLMKYFDYDTYIYTSGFVITNNYRQFFTNIYRVIIGMTGILLFAGLILRYCDKLHSIFKNLISWFGQRSLILYIIQGYIVIILGKLNLKSGFSYGVLLFETIVVISISMLLVEVIKKISYGYILLGEKNNFKNK